MISKPISRSPTKHTFHVKHLRINNFKNFQKGKPRMFHVKLMLKRQRHLQPNKPFFPNRKAPNNLNYLRFKYRNAEI